MKNYGDWTLQRTGYPCNDPYLMLNQDEIYELESESKDGRTKFVLRKAFE